MESEISPAANGSGKSTKLILIVVLLAIVILGEDFLLMANLSKKQIL